MDHLDNRVCRIIGQLKGVQKMVKDERNCPDILQQIMAIKKAIDSFSKEIIILYVGKDLPEDKKKQFELMLNRAINL